ncbi:MAG TPA: hypothetical protein ENI73_03100 [Spirochaetes bacterium]|nr:hypothetical protein [Spirochaetota bacterium]
MGLIAGAGYPFKGFKYLWGHKKLFRYVAIPFTIDLIVTGLLIYIYVTQLSAFTGYLDSLGELWYLKPLVWVFRVIGYFLLILLFPFILNLCSALIDPVFRGILYSKTREMEGFPEKNYTPGEGIKRLIKGICNEIKKLILYLTLSLILVPLNILPPLYLVLHILLTALFIGWEFITPYLEEKNLGFLRQFFFVLKRFRVVSGFGLSASLLLFIPLLQVLFLSTHTIGGALLSIDMDKS